MIRELLQIVDRVPYVVFFRDIAEFDRFEERFFDVEGRIGDIVGMIEDAVEFCPNSDPPTRDEILAWCWVIYPEHKEEILSLANDDLKALINEYDEYA